MSVSLAISSFLWVDFSNPSVALGVVFLGMCGVYCEFCRPGFVLPGVLGATLVVLGAAALARFPINWRGAALMVVSFGFLATGRYLWSLAGAITLLAGTTILIDSPRIHLATALAITLPFAALTSFLFSIAIRARRNKVVRGYPERKT